VCTDCSQSSTSKKRKTSDDESGTIETKGVQKASTIDARGLGGSIIIIYFDSTTNHIRMWRKSLKNPPDLRRLKKPPFPLPVTKKASLPDSESDTASKIKQEVTQSKDENWGNSGEGNVGGKLDEGRRVFRKHLMYQTKKRLRRPLFQVNRMARR
jgi:hypothetical protein